MMASKELEALKRITGEINNYKLSGIGDENWLGIQDVLKDVDILENALTPPTADEVCKALSKWIEENPMVAYDEVYYDDKKKSFKVGQYASPVCYKDDAVIWFNWVSLPPHLITLIGRFYEGLEKVGKNDDK